MKAQPLGGACGIAITDLNCAEDIDERTADDLRTLLQDHGLLIIRGQTLTKAQQARFSRLFGDLEIHPLAQQVDPEEPTLIVLDSRGRDGNVEPADPEAIVGLIDWHTDLGYVMKPNYAGVLYGRILPPEGGLTGFVDRAATYDALSDAMKQKIEGLHVVQSWRHSQEQISKNPAFQTDEGAKVMAMDLFADLAFPLVIPHPLTGRKILNVSSMWSSAIVEMPGAEGEALIAELIAHSLQDQFVYWHSYTPGDVAVWDNYRMIHAASGTKGKYRRQLYRTTISGRGDLGGRPLDEQALRDSEQRIAALRNAYVGARDA